MRNWLILVLAAAVAAAAASAAASEGVATPIFGTLGYPWPGATHIPVPPASDRYTWGFRSCRRDIGRNCALSTLRWHGTRYYLSDPWGYYLRNCTSYVAWKLRSLGIAARLVVGNGNAAMWPSRTHAKGLRHGSTPREGSVAVNRRADGRFGHIAFVTGVHGDGTITVSEYNAFALGGGDRWTGRPSARGFTTFIYFNAGASENR
ncbi:MAG TPA: CHAP domain-containing protein [Gaiellaceae bacterium]